MPHATCLHCHSLQYYLQNSTKYFTSGTQLFFLSGLHFLYTDLIIENVHNISLSGRNNGYSDAIVQCDSSVGIIMNNITNLSIENMVIRNCQNQYSSAVTVMECSFVKLHYMEIYQTSYPKQGLSLLGIDIMGISILNHITCDRQMYFHYQQTNTILNKHVISLNHYNIMENFTGHYAIYVLLNQLSFSLAFQISNTTVDEFVKFLTVQATHTVKRSTVAIANCQFSDHQYEHNLRLFELENVNVYILIITILHSTVMKLSYQYLEVMQWYLVIVYFNKIIFLDL